MSKEVNVHDPVELWKRASVEARNALTSTPLPLSRGKLVAFSFISFLRNSMDDEEGKGGKGAQTFHFYKQLLVHSWECKVFL